MSEITIARSEYPPVRGGLKSQSRGIPLSGGSSVPSRVLEIPGTWFVTSGGTNLSAFSGAEVTLGQVTGITDNTITTCYFNAVYTAFNYQSQDAMLEVTLYGGGSVVWRAETSILSALQLPTPPPPVFCNNVASFFLWICGPEGEGSVVFGSQIYGEVDGFSVNVWGSWRQC